MTEQQKITQNSKRWDDDKLPKILKEGMTENQWKS